MKVRDVKAAIGSLELEGLKPNTETVQHLYSLTEEYKRHKVGKGNISVCSADYCEIVSIHHKQRKSPYRGSQVPKK